MDRGVLAVINEAYKVENLGEGKKERFSFPPHLN